MRCLAPSINAANSPGGCEPNPDARAPPSGSWSTRSNARSWLPIPSAPSPSAPSEISAPQGAVWCHKRRHRTPSNSTNRNPERKYSVNLWRSGQNCAIRDTSHNQASGRKADRVPCLRGPSRASRWGVVEGLKTRRGLVQARLRRDMSDAPGVVAVDQLQISVATGVEHQWSTVVITEVLHSADEQRVITGRVGVLHCARDVGQGTA